MPVRFNSAENIDDFEGKSPKKRYRGYEKESNFSKLQRIKCKEF